ncbi:RNA polymerase subunit sigma-70 [Streptomyces seoulensis]|nr:RNA polymerase subunit sigma-70 [Streptomyces seoulensis]
MREWQAWAGADRARDFESFVAGAGGRLLHTATLLTAEAPDDNPRARRLLTRALAHTYASWGRLRDDDPYDHVRRRIATRFARETWRGHTPPLPRARPPLHGALAVLPPRERLVVVLALYEGVAEEQTAALLGLPAQRVHVLYDRAVAALVR